MIAPRNRSLDEPAGTHARPTCLLDHALRDYHRNCLPSWIWDVPPWQNEPAAGPRVVEQRAVRSACWWMGAPSQFNLAERLGYADVARRQAESIFPQQGDRGADVIRPACRSRRGDVDPTFGLCLPRKPQAGKTPFVRNGGLPLISRTRYGDTDFGEHGPRITSPRASAGGP